MLTTIGPFSYAPSHIMQVELHYDNQGKICFYFIWACVAIQSETASWPNICIEDHMELCIHTSDAATTVMYIYDTYVRTPENHCKAVRTSNTLILIAL